MSAPARDDARSWRGKLAGRVRGSAATRLVAPIEQSGSGTAAFLGLADDGEFYWIKSIDNPQGLQSIVNEVLVSRIGEMLGAPVRPTKLISVSPSFAGWSMADGWPLGAGIAHGSLRLANTVEDDELRHVRMDDNARRHAQIVALWDLCMGDDPQWLFDLDAERSTWSFDHGFWFGGELGWTIDQLDRDADRGWAWPGSVRGIDSSELVRMADAIAGLSPELVMDAISGVPVEWGVIDEDLEAIGWFVHHRRVQVSERLRHLAGNN